MYIQEPITFFGESTGQLPAAFQTTATPTATSVSTPGALSSSTPSSSRQTASPNKGGPVANQAQQTGTNVFGASNDDTTGDAFRNSISIGKMVLGSLMAGVIGGAMVFA